MYMLTDGVRKDVPESMMFADGIFLCGCKEVDMTEYLDTRRKSLQERRRPKTQSIYGFHFCEQGNRVSLNILGKKGKELLISNTSGRV